MERSFNVLRITTDMVEDMQGAIQDKVAEVLHEQLKKMEGKDVPPSDVFKNCLVNSKSKWGPLPATTYIWRNQAVISLLDPVVQKNGKTILSIVKHLENNKVKVVAFSFAQDTQIIH